jgi:integrase
MPSVHLTDAAVKRLKTPEHGRIECFDASFPAFGVRVSQTGRKSWIFFYRYHDRLRRLTIGTYPTKSLAEAREAAHNAQRKLEQGIDPGDEKATQRAAERARRNSFEAVATDFIDKYAKRKNRDWRKAQYLLNKEALPYWRDLDVGEITRRDVHDVLDRIVERGAPVHANRTLAVIRKLLNWAVDRDIIAVSPAAGVKPPINERSRDRVLNDDELKAIWEAAGKTGYPFGPMYRLLMITGQRLGEVAGMQWTHIHDDVWTMPQTKNTRPHDLPLTRMALDVLKGLPRFTGPYVFSGSNGERAVSGFSKAKKRIDGLAGVSNWRNHDLRRTLSTNMARLDVAPHVVEKILNHSSGTISGVAAVYNRYGYDREKRQALEAWAKRLEAIVSGECTANVVPIAEGLPSQG